MSVSRLFSVLAALLATMSCFSQGLTNVGTDFWVAFPANFGGTSDLHLFISSQTATTGTVTMTFPVVSTQSFSVVPGTVTQVTVPSSLAVSNSGMIESKGIRIIAVDPVSVYGLNRKPATTDAYVAYPVTSLGTDYRVMSYKTTLNNLGSAFCVVASQNNTSLTIFNSQTGTTYPVVLQEGETYYEEAPVINHDLTGSHIEADHPVAVYGSVEAANVPQGCNFADHIIEQMMPVSSWGLNFITVPLAGRDASGDIFRILAAENGTSVTVNGLPAALLDAGQFHEILLADASSIGANKPVLLAQFARGIGCTGNLTGDPFMVLIPPREQFLTDYTVSTVAGFTSHWINLVAPSYAINSIVLDGTQVPVSSFTLVGTTPFYGARIQITEGSHTLSGSFPFGVFVYGWTNADSYGYAGGVSLSPVSTVANVTLSPLNSNGILNVSTVCLNALVTDALNNPVANVLVDFTVTGLNALAGFGYTDNNGIAQYCYTQTGTVSGTDQVVATVFGLTSNPAGVSWTYTQPCVNPSDGGTIGSDQTGCGNFTAEALTELISPAGYTGNPEYRWQQSATGVSADFLDIPGASASGYSPGVISQTTWYRRMVRVDCMPAWDDAALSNVVAITVVTPLIPGIVIAPDQYAVCSGVAVTFTAMSTNGGSSPFYQWKVNGTNAGSSSPVFTHIPADGDIITCQLTSSEPCVTENPVTSNTVAITVWPVLPVSVAVTVSSNPVCSGSTVTFTALPVNAGSAPGFAWRVNGISAGSNNQVFQYIPLNNDQVTCTLTSSEGCASGNPATSGPVSMTVNPLMPVSVSIISSINPFCTGSTVMMTATPVNGGANPVYQWQVNGVNAGNNGQIFIFTPVSNDQVRCILTSGLECVLFNPAISNTVTLMAAPLPAVTFTSCFDTITTVSARPFNLRGGLPVGGIYSGAGVNSATGIFTPSEAGQGNHLVGYSFTNVYGCESAAMRTIQCVSSPAFTCGSVLHDIRDGNNYPTVQIGTQCWMARNLDFGQGIPESTPQTDNCIAEYYMITSSLPDPDAFYQWDEVMQYQTGEGSGGLCPPGWHVPSVSEWNILFNFYQGQGLAGGPMQDTLINGFGAQMKGMFYAQNFGYFSGFAAMLWSSSLTGTGNDRAIAFGMNTLDNSVSFYPALRSNAFGIRCLKD